MEMLFRRQLPEPIQIAHMSHYVEFELTNTNRLPSWGPLSEMMPIELAQAFITGLWPHMQAEIERNVVPMLQRDVTNPDPKGPPIH